MLGDCHARLDRIRKMVACDLCKMQWKMGDEAPLCPRAKSLAAGGHKDDADKVRMELIPPELMIAVGDILTSGAKKYDDRNWEQGMKWSRVYGALLRHLIAWWGGEKKDPETGRSHLWHAGCCITFLIAYEMRGVGEDDRWKG